MDYGGIDYGINKNSSTSAKLFIVAGIAKQKRAEQEITAWKTRYQGVIAASGRLVREHDVNTGGMLWGNYLEQVLGYSPDEMRGRTR